MNWATVLQSNPRCPRMTKREAELSFDAVLSPMPDYQRRDLPLVREAWAVHLDSLERCGAITMKQAASWTLPAWATSKAKRKRR